MSALARLVPRWSSLLMRGAGSGSLVWCMSTRGMAAGVNRREPREHTPRWKQAHLKKKKRQREDAVERGEGAKSTHYPVMLTETIDALLEGMTPNAPDGGLYIDATFGHGGHCEALLKATEVPPKSKPTVIVEDGYNVHQKRDPEEATGWCDVLAVDLDIQSRTKLKQITNFRHVKKRLHWHHGPFGDLSSHVLDLVQSGELRAKKVDAELAGGLNELNSIEGSKEVDVTEAEVEKGAEDSAITAAGAVQGLVDGVLFDVGMSSRQLQRPERGFRVLVDAPLDMRMNAGSHPQSVQTEEGDPVTAASIINSLSEEALTRLLTVLGEEPGAAAIAKCIVEYRERRGPLERTTDLVDIVNAALGIDPEVKITSGPLPAVKTFMAIRRAVNREIEELAKGLRHAERLLRPGGKLVVITFNSLESRVINHFLESREHSLHLGLPAVTELPGHVESGAAVMAASKRMPLGENLWAAQRARNGEMGMDGVSGQAVYAHCSTAGVEELHANTRSRYAVLWSLTRGTGVGDAGGWARELEALDLDSILASPTTAAHPR